ncbi:MAG: hypothetical protein ABI459_03695, partial [Deltaproteobacteria bacterium]
MMGLTGNKVQTGTAVSGVGHIALLLWLVVGGWLSSPDPLPPMGSTNVTMMTSDEFDALNAPSDTQVAPVAETDVTTPPTPAAEQPAETPPTPEPVVETPPEVVVPEPQPVQPEPEPEMPQVDPVPVPPEPVPEDAEVLPDFSATPGATDAPTARDTPAARPQNRVADTTVEAAPEVTDAPDAVPETTPEETTEPVPVVEPTEVAAPKPSSEVTVNADAKPTKADRPKSKPAAKPPAPTVETVTSTADEDAVTKALQDAMEGGAEAEVPTSTSQQPAGGGRMGVTGVESAGLVGAISDCWNLGSSSSDALRTTVVVLVDMAPDGSATGVTLVSSDGPTQQATDTAFGAARVAVLRCSKNNRKPLPADKY